VVSRVEGLFTPANLKYKIVPLLMLPLQLYVKTIEFAEKIQSVALLNEIPSKPNLHIKELLPFN